MSTRVNALSTPSATYLLSLKESQIDRSVEAPKSFLRFDSIHRFDNLLSTPSPLRAKAEVSNPKTFVVRIYVFLPGTEDILYEL